MTITQGDLKSALKYNPDTGEFIRRVSVTNSAKGGVSGSLNGSGYEFISVGGKRYQSHRLAFMYMLGYFPEHHVDHINRVPSDNRWENLREVSQSCNMRNTAIRKNNTSGITGVSFDIPARKWKSQIRANGVYCNLGRFDNFDDAVKARWKAEVKYGYPNCNTTSSARQYLVENNLI